jgi:hypothetical protein
MSPYFRLFWTWLRANFKARFEHARRAMGLDPASPAFPATISAWIDTERLMSA